MSNVIQLGVTPVKQLTDDVRYELTHELNAQAEWAYNYYSSNESPMADFVCSYGYGDDPIFSEDRYLSQLLDKLGREFEDDISYDKWNHLTNVILALPKDKQDQVRDVILYDVAEFQVGDIMHPYGVTVYAGVVGEIEHEIDDDLYDRICEYADTEDLGDYYREGRYMYIDMHYTVMRMVITDINEVVEAINKYLGDK